MKFRNLCKGLIIALLSLSVVSKAGNLKVSWDCRKMFSDLKNSREKIVAYSSQGEAIGWLHYEVTSKKEIYIVGLAILDAYQRQGVGTALFIELANEHPEIKRIRTDFKDDNEEVFKAMKANGASDVAAMQATPAFKQRKAAGFGKISRWRSSFDLNYPHLTVYRD